MKLEIASFKAVKFACENFHYSKKVPVNFIGYSVFNGDAEWCGVVVFNLGVRGIEKPFGLQNGQVAELVRVALNGKQETTSKAVSIAVKLFKRQNPLVKLLVSYADSDESHYGVIYQAMNWFFIGEKRTGDKYLCKKTKREVHKRQITKGGYTWQFGKLKKAYSKEDLIVIKKGVKYKYIWPIDRSLFNFCKSIAKSYPKKTFASEAQEAVRCASSTEGAVRI